MLQPSQSANQPEEKNHSLQQRLRDVLALVGDETIVSPEIETTIANLETQIRALLVTLANAAATDAAEKTAAVSPSAATVSKPPEDPEEARKQSVTKAIDFQGIKAATYEEACEKYAHRFPEKQRLLVHCALADYDPNSDGRLPDFIHQKINEELGQETRLAAEALTIENWEGILRNKVDHTLNNNAQNISERSRRQYLEWVNSLKGGEPVHTFESAVLAVAIRHEILAKEMIIEQRQLHPTMPLMHIASVVLSGLAWSVVKFRPIRDKKNMIDEFIAKAIRTRCRNQWK